MRRGPPPPGATRAEHAAHYAALGWALIPLEPGRKTPTVRGWPERPIQGPEAAHTFWTRHPQHNLGVLHALSGTAALDIDHLEGARLALAEVGADLDALLETPVRLRGAKGEKPLYHAPDLLLTRRALTWPHPDYPGHKLTVLELRGGPGCQDVLPPSLHPHGMVYTWAGGPPAQQGDLEPLPEVMRHLWTHWDALRPALEAACPWATPQPEVQARPPRTPGGGWGEGIIGMFNAHHTVFELLERHGYRRQGERWIAPSSESGTAGVLLLEGRVYSHHTSDPLGDGHAHDAFGVYTALEHGGNPRQALRAARALLGRMGAPSGWDSPACGWESDGGWDSSSPWDERTSGGW